MEIKKRRPLRSALFLKIKYLNILLFGNFLSSTGLAEHSKTLVESFDASAGINNLLFAGIESGYVDSRTVETARRMAEKGIDPKTISDVLDVSEDDLSDILAMPSGASSASEK